MNLLYEGEYREVAFVCQLLYPRRFQEKNDL